MLLGLLARAIMSSSSTPKALPASAFRKNSAATASRAPNSHGLNIQFVETVAHEPKPALLFAINLVFPPALEPIGR
jgi:hypothetical protein